MSILKKISLAYRSGILTEKLAQSVLDKFSQFLIETCRLRAGLVVRRSERLALKLFPTKDIAKEQLTTILGNMAGSHNLFPAKFRSAVLSRAEAYLTHKFDILGSGEQILSHIDWHTDFKSGFKWQPGLFFKDYQQVDLRNSADVKVPRELSRCHHFLTLGQAYLCTGDESFSREYVAQLGDWIDENPFMRSINLACSMDVAIRAVNWLWSFHFFIDSPVVTDQFILRVFSSLFQHYYFIHVNPEKSPPNNTNHYIANLVGQIYLGFLFAKIDKGNRWLVQATRDLYREIRRQVLPTGPSYERSVNYHRLDLELISSAIIVLRRNNIEIPADVWYRLETMFQFTLNYIKPDGTAPVIGDLDDGRLHPFGLENNLHHRYLLSVGSVLFERGDFKAHSEGYNPDCIALFGADSKEVFNRIQTGTRTLASSAFPDAGFFISRKGKDYMFINLSGKGGYSELGGGTHTHSDLLSFELFVGDKTFLVDPGSYVYSSDPSSRMLFRSTKMHNTVVVDGEDQNIIQEDMLWDFERSAIPKLNRWISNGQFDLFDGEHSGYNRLKFPVTHRRMIHFLKKYSEWEITDILSGEGAHLFEWYFHFDADIDFKIKGNSVVTLCRKGANISVNFNSRSGYEIHSDLGWVSKAYGRKETARFLKVRMNGVCPVTLKTTIKRRAAQV